MRRPEGQASVTLRALYGASAPRTAEELGLETQLKPVRRRVSVETMEKFPAIMEWMHPEVPTESEEE